MSGAHLPLARQPTDEPPGTGVDATPSAGRLLWFPGHIFEERSMASWELHGVAFGNCNCNWGCPCQFNSPTTHGSCEGVLTGRVDRGHFDGTSLDGLCYAMVFQWPGEIAEGNGRQQAIIDASASPEQREGLRKILHGEDTAPGATHYYVYNSMMSEVLDTLYLPIDLEIDVEARTGRARVEGLVEVDGSPITDPNSGAEFAAQIQLPTGFEYTTAEMGTASCRVTGEIQLDLSDSYGQWNEIHMNQDGVIR
jgi:hypothetical protein